ncbi:capsular polysaccharide biosynthesis protein [Vibrio nigripulchritudo]|uniref:outer membrane beta-barrel protein n=1 Tax=Vibrio nigripulchritudo TaxID=28173 RepID=UPI00190C29D2|nr:outer membrane beta-barrel protein [Vibrio nigripulchritudo]BCL73148.1 capsular polysaccharide biosynthesis protein [Vibrio nigripulchritudo]BDU34511.1 capsular polysaccharide biosynthesis protein [Vibrio nigripulchritudo]
MKYSVKRSLCLVSGIMALANVAPISAEPFVTESGIEVAPGFKARFGQNDNLLRVSDSNNATSTSFLVVDPGVSLKFQPRENEFLLSYRLSHGRYFSSSEDNFTDHFFDSRNLIKLGLRHAIKADLRVASLHEVRGTGLTEGDNTSSAIDRPLEYLNRSIVTTYIYGAPGAKGRIEAKLGYSDLEYKNFRHLGGVSDSRSSRFKDYDNRYAGLKFAYRWLTNTKAIFEYEIAKKNYDFTANGVPSQDSLTHNYYAGLEWDVSGKTSGYAKVGIQDKNFDDSDREDFTGLSWLVGLDWNPLYHSTWSIQTSQVARDPDQDGDFVKETILNVGWKHYWRPQIYTRATAVVSNQEYTGAFQNGVLRDERAVEWSANVGYEFNEIVDFFVGVKKTNKTSNWEGYGYDQLVWSLSGAIAY